MQRIVHWLETIFDSSPLPLLEVWGRFSYVLGIAIALCAFCGFTFKLGERWRFGREQQAWDAKAFLCMPLTFVLIVISGYLGSFIVLVPGAQTFESLKDLVVFLCVVLFGYPALITVPFAYGLSDTIEGVPPGFLLDWLPGYFINPACFWLAYQLFGKNPDFRRLRTWSRYLCFVLIFMALEPVLWGFICSSKFTAEISYRSITPALFFTTSITWLLAPFAMLGALPLARRLGLFWAEIPGHVKERALGAEAWIWEAGRGAVRQHAADSGQKVPLRMFILTPFIVLVLMMVGATAYVALRSAETDAHKLVTRLHEEISENIKFQLDEYLARTALSQPAEHSRGIDGLLANLRIAKHGRAFIIDRAGRLVASCVAGDDPVVAKAITALRETLGTNELRSNVQFRFNLVTQEPLSRETWLAHANAYRDRQGGHIDWILMTLMPASFYQAGLREGNSRSAMVFALALLLSLAMAAGLAFMVTAPLRRISTATAALARGDLSQRVPSSRLEELNALTQSFNQMAEQLKTSFDELLNEVETRKAKELALGESEARLRTSENRLQLAVEAAGLGIWDWDVEKDELLWDDSMYRLYGLRKEEFTVAYDAWTKCLVPQDMPRAAADVEAALRGPGEYVSEFRIRRNDGAIRVMRGVGRTLRAEDGRPLRMVGINWDVTEQLTAEQELRKHRDHLEDLVKERTLALHETKEQADAANRAKSRFLANMSHEIRTPMNAILGFGQLMRRDSDLSPRDQQRLGKILASGDHLLALINNVLEMSKIEAGRVGVNPSTFDLPDTIADVEGMVRGRIEEKGLTFTLQGVESLPRYVRSDAAKLRQILINLLGNALKFTQHGSVTLRASLLENAGAVKLRFEVQDTGIGIAPEEISRVFEPFEQTASGLQAQTGTGLGAAISRDFARLMGGDLRVRSELGLGTTFELDVRVELGSLADVAATSDEGSRVLAIEPGQKVPLILVVDDEEDNRLALSELLVSVGIEVVQANDGARAVDRFVERGPDLIFMDVKMPVMDGVEATRRIRQLQAGASVPIIVLSASVFDDTRASALSTDASEFIAKPFRIGEIWAALERHLGLRFLRQSLRPTAPAPKPTREQVAALGSETVVALREALEVGYVDRVPTLLAQLGSEHAPVAAALSKLASNFEIEALLELL